MPELPLLTRIYGDWRGFELPTASCYIYARSNEERSRHPGAWEQGGEDCRFVEIVRQKRFAFSARFGGATHEILIRSRTALSNFISQVQSPGGLYVNITGLEHHVWAPIVREGLSRSRPIRAVYVEPEHYRYSSNPTEGRLFDLTARFTEISSLPGFARLESIEDEAKTCFVPLLGFEGNRLAHAIEKIDPPVENILPVIGVPGFRAGFPFNTYLGNRGALEKDGLWKQVRFAIANSPFSAIESLRAIAADYPDHLLKIAPLGTRPHALGAVLFALNSSAQVELVYDNPTPAPQRSDGAGSILVYDVTAMVS